MSDTEQRLARIRQEIDVLDEQIQALISQRAECAAEVGRVKRTEGAEPAFYYRPEREAKVLRGVVERNQGPLSSEEMARLFREIMSACLALEKPMNIAFLGPEGTFTQAAAHKHFGKSINTTPLAAIDEVFREVESGAAHYGVVPVENSTEGVINHTLDTFVLSPLKICGEVELRIHHHLLGNEQDLKAIKRVYSHQQSLAQCREWLDLNFPHVEREPVSSNAEAARRAAAEAETAAIAGIMTAEIYGLKILVSNIEDEPENTTRFLIVGRNPVPVSGNDKTTLLLSTSNKPGALYRLLNPLNTHGISMSRIESRPSRRGTWDYVFFIDIEGHAEEHNVKAALTELEEGASLFKVLGSYPKAVL